ncbi:MAG: hypothetical protein ACQEQG_08730 [Bacillota bacterium]
MKKEMIKKLIIFRHVINNKLDIKHIFQYAIGVTAGAIAFSAYANNDMVLFTGILIGFSLLNQIFHKFFKYSPIARVMVKKEDMDDEDFKNKITEAIKKSIKNDKKDE